MRPMHLILNAMNEKLTIRHVAKVLGISEAQVYKLGQPWNQSGRAPTLKQAIAYLEMAAEAGLLETDELFEYFANAARRKAIASNVIELFNRGIKALNNGGKLDDKPDIADFLLCVICSQPRQPERDDGRTACVRCKNPMCAQMKREPEPG